MRVTNERLRDVAEFRVIPEDIGEAERMMLALDLIDARADAERLAEALRSLVDDQGFMMVGHPGSRHDRKFVDCAICNALRAHDAAVKP